MLTNFLHALVQSWDSASGQMAPVPPTVWLSKGDCGVCFVSVCVRENVTVWSTAGPQSLSLKDLLTAHIAALNTF